MTESELRQLKGKFVVLRNKFGGIYTGRIGTIKTSHGRRKVALRDAHFCSPSTPEIRYHEEHHIGMRWYFVDDITVWLRGQEPMFIVDSPYRNC